MKALLVVDVQNDFCPGGALAVKNGDKVVPIINLLMDQFDLVIASKDWHPEKTVHFKKWPVHCVRNTHGAEFHPALRKEKIEKVFLKGTGDKDDGYSAFEASSDNLDKYLRQKQVDELYVTGLATDYCVKQTAEDAIRKGFKTYLVMDAVMAVNVAPDDGEKAFVEMEKAGVKLIKSADV